MPRVTINNINAALKCEGLPFEIVKGSGYFWFAALDGAPMGCEDGVGSIYSNHLTGMSVGEYVDHVRSSFNEWSINNG